MRPDLERLLEASYRRVVGRDLRTDAGGHPYDAPAALLRDGNEADPVFCYANPPRSVCGGPDLGRIHPPAVAALAELLVRAERDRLLPRVRGDGFCICSKRKRKKNMLRAPEFPDHPDFPG